MSDQHLPEPLPPLPPWPGMRYVIDAAGPENVSIAQRRIDLPGTHPSTDVSFTNIRVVKCWQRGEPDLIPARVERALHLALSCCDSMTGNCDDEAVKRAWRDSK